MDAVSVAFSRPTTRLTAIYSRASAGSETTKKRPNLYKLLSLDSANVGPDGIKKAYRSMALRCHPDACPPSRKEEATRMFIELNRAYETLSDPVLRRMYDLELRTGETEGPSAQSGHLSVEVWDAQLRELARRSERRWRYKARVGRIR